MKTLESGVGVTTGLWHTGYGTLTLTAWSRMAFALNKPCLLLLLIARLMPCSHMQRLSSHITSYTLAHTHTLASTRARARTNTHTHTHTHT